MVVLDIGVEIKPNKKVGLWGDYRAIAARVEARQASIAYNTARTLEAVVKRLVPQPPGHAWWGSDYERTGKLLASVGRDRLAVGNHRVSVSAKNDRGQEYAPFVEYGTSKMPATPFFHQSIAIVADTALREEVKNWLKP